MLRKLISAFMSAISALFRVLERGWDGVWRVVLSPIRAVLGPPPIQPCEAHDVATEAQLTEILADEQAMVRRMSQAQSAARLAAVEAERETPAVEPAKAEPRPIPRPTEMTPSQRLWAERIAARTMQVEEEQRHRGEAIRQAMLAGDLTALPEEERAALEALDDFEWNDLVEEDDALAIAKQVDAHVRGYAQLQALHARLERERKLDQPPEPRSALGM